MVSTLPICHSPLELAQRVRSGIEVTLYWCPTDNSTSIEVWHPASGARLGGLVPGEHALDAFYHPFAHLLMASSEARPALEAGGRS